MRVGGKHRLQRIDRARPATFLAGRDHRGDVEKTDAMNPSAADSLEVVLEADRWAREFAAGYIRKSLR